MFSFLLLRLKWTATTVVVDLTAKHVTTTRTHGLNWCDIEQSTSYHIYGQRPYRARRFLFLLLLFFHSLSLLNHEYFKCYTHFYWSFTGLHFYFLCVYVCLVLICRVCHTNGSMVIFFFLVTFLLYTNKIILVPVNKQTNERANKYLYEKRNSKKNVLLEHGGTPLWSNIYLINPQGNGS